MGIYIYAFVICILLGKFMFDGVSSKVVIDKRKKKYLFFVTLLLGLISGFRSTSVGYDTYSYSLIFNDIMVGSFEKMIESVGRIEPGFALWCGIIKILGGNFQWLLITTSLFIVGSFSIFVYRHSKSVLWSIFILFCFQYYYSSFDIIRHFMATSFLLLGYKYVEQRKIIPFLLFIFIGSLFHKIAFIFTLYYFVPLVKWNTKIFVLFAIMVLIVNMLISKISIGLSLLFGKGDYTQMHGTIQWIGAYSGGVKTFILFFILFFFMFYIYRVNKKTRRVNETTNNSSLTLCLLMLMFSFLFINARIMTRFVMTSSAFLAIAIPNILISDRPFEYFHIKQKNISLIIILLGLVYNSFLLYVNWQNIVPYVPFWQ
ncbi:MAG: EpsG family protein [Bacteroidales bacterium]|nr:EpsG family protein [Bacteroidales bacterium]